MMRKMKAPAEIVRKSTGEEISLRSLYEERPLALVFLRHFGCIFCREQVADLRDHPDRNIAFVCMAGPDEAEDFRRLMKSPHVFLCDPEAKLYEDFELERGSVKQMFGGEVWRRGFGAGLKGHAVGRPVGDPWRMPGEFILGTDGSVVWEHRPRHAGDHSPADVLIGALEKAAKAPVQP